MLYHETAEEINTYSSVVELSWCHNAKNVPTKFSYDACFTVQVVNL